MRLLHTVALITLIFFGCRYTASDRGESARTNEITKTNVGGTYPSVSRLTVKKSVLRTYRALLWREGDEGGVENYTDLIVEKAMEGWSLTLRSIAESEEFKNNIRPFKTDAEILAQLYEQLLGPNRPVDPSGEAAYLPLIAKNRVADVAEYVGTSDEFFEKLLTLQDDRPAPPENLKVAFLGDQGLNSSSREVLKLVAREGAELLVILGDFDYEGDPKAWEAMLNAALGPDFPLLGVVGNHDVSQWEKPIGYRNVFTNRLAKMPDASCSGDYGVNSTCVYKNLFFAMSGIGTHGTGHEAYLANELPRTQHMWKICAWHKLQKKMHAGGKPDETGWPVYETCRKNGAIVATAHEHSYSRTHLMSNFETQQMVSTSNTLNLELGKSFAFTSGLGGHSIREQKLYNPWIASAYTSTQRGTHGVLFCTFNIDGRADEAGCYFKNIRNEIIDQFTVVAPPMAGINRAMASDQ